MNAAVLFSCCIAPQVHGQGRLRQSEAENEWYIEEAGSLNRLDWVSMTVLLASVAVMAAFGWVSFKCRPKNVQEPAHAPPRHMGAPHEECSKPIGFAGEAYESSESEEGEREEKEGPMYQGAEFQAADEATD
eukprot:Polyplicarium_translucidae@DN3191_c0_g1_i1.p1